MYTNVHGCTGAIIYASCPNKLLGGVLAVLSHYLLDYLGESCYGSKWLELIIEGVLLVIFILIALLLKDPTPYFIGWTLGNLPDLIDKRFFLNRSAKQYLSCHGAHGWSIYGVRFGLFSINDWKLGYPSKIKFNKIATFRIGFAASAALFMFTLFKIVGII